MAEDLIREYAKAAEALANWFISQEIPVGRACGIMMYLAGVSIGECAASESDLRVGIKRHIAVLEHLAKVAFAGGKHG